MKREEWSKEKLILEKTHFWCNAIELKQAVEGTLQVLRKPLATVLDEVHFTVNLYSFPLPLVPQENPSVPKVISTPMLKR